MSGAVSNPKRLSLSSFSQVVVGALQQAVEAQTPTSPNPLPWAMQLVTNISTFMHALPHLDRFTLLAARSVPRTSLRLI